jgi:hypothetical protein
MYQMLEYSYQKVLQSNDWVAKLARSIMVKSMGKAVNQPQVEMHERYKKQNVYVI